MNLPCAFKTCPGSLNFTLLIKRYYQVIKKVKMDKVLGAKFQDKTKPKRCDSSIQKLIVGKHCCYKGKHLFCNMFHVIWAFSKRYAGETPPITLK